MAFVDKSKLMQRIETEAFRWGDEYDLSQIMGDIEDFPEADVVEIPKSGIGDMSDGYHTFNELYHHRAVLFSAICNSMPDKAWKSKLHDTGDMFEGMFIVGIETPDGQATYHYDIEYWDMFKVRELEKAPKWDGHNPTDAINRITKLSADAVEVKHGSWTFARSERKVVCSCCETPAPFDKKVGYHTLWGSPYCPNCGAKMDAERNDEDGNR